MKKVFDFGHITVLLLGILAIVIFFAAVPVEKEKQEAKMDKVIRCLSNNMFGDSGPNTAEYLKTFENIYKVDEILSYDKTLTPPEKERINKYLENQLIEGERLCKEKKEFEQKKSLEKMKDFKERVLSSE